jgi:virginiamycin A acetyltransferase
MGMFLDRMFGHKGKGEVTSVFMNKNEKYAKYKIGDFTYGRPRVFDWSDGTTLSIGKFCSIAEDVTIILGGGHRMDWISTYPFPAFVNEFPNAEKISGHPSSKGDVKIGNDVWIGFGTTILSGVTIGNGACIGANTTVTKNVHPYEVVAGSPMKTIRYRFSEKVIADLMEIQWWNWEIEKINSRITCLLNGDVEKMIEELKK